MSWLADTPESALGGVRIMVDGVVADMQRAGEDVPEPLAMERT